MGRVRFWSFNLSNVNTAWNCFLTSSDLSKQRSSQSQSTLTYNIQVTYQKIS
jgi:hypothetical protein